MLSNHSNQEMEEVLNANKKYFDDNIRNLSERETRWLQRYLVKKDIEFRYLDVTDSNEDLARKLANRKDFKDLIREGHLQMSTNLIPEDSFEWIKNSLRKQIFVLQILLLEYNYRFDLINNDLMDKIYIYFDNDSSHHRFNTITNHSVLKQMENNWNIVEEKDNYFKWLKEANKEQINWTRDYLKKENIYNGLTKNIFLHKEVREVILASLDLIDYPYVSKPNKKYFIQIHPDRKERIIEKMKRAWSQKKYRDAGKTKTQYHLALTKTTKARLDKMALVQGAKSTEILDMLINSAYEADYLNEHGKDLY